ncbi:MAG TPA: tripartite tricarboxylate transporter substrate-binding protein [Burkholderiales bacterium]|nr:tripartite tricarboxylate transporter substrate-binding protein [Burkholderiales bacterium]
MTRTALLILASSLLACACAHAAYPTRRIEIVAAGAAGGGLDAAGRALDRALHDAKLIDQPMFITNIQGAAGDAAKNYVHQKKGDAHVLYAESNRIFQNKILGTTLLGVDDFVPLARLVTEYLVWVVRADAPQRSAKDILDQVKGDPASVAFGVGSTPSNDYFNIVRPALQYGADYKKLRIASFRSGGNLMIQLLGGHVQVISTTASEALEQVKSGKARLIATSAPSPQGGDLKGVPHWRGMGIDMHILHWRGLFAPAGTPREVVAFWDERLGKLMKSEAWKKVLEQYGWADAFADSAQFKRELEAERAVTAKLLRELGFAK